MLTKSRACFFLRSPKRRRQLGHRHKGLGDPKITQIIYIGSTNDNLSFQRRCFEIIKYAHGHIPCVDIYERDILFICMPVDIY